MRKPPPDIRPPARELGHRPERQSPRRHLRPIRRRRRPPDRLQRLPALPGRRPLAQRAGEPGHGSERVDRRFGLRAVDGAPALQRCGGRVRDGGSGRVFGFGRAADVQHGGAEDPDALSRRSGYERLVHRGELSGAAVCVADVEGCARLRRSLASRFDVGVVGVVKSMQTVEGGNAKTYTKEHSHIPYHSIDQDLELKPRIHKNSLPTHSLASNFEEPCLKHLLSPHLISPH